MRDYKDDYYGEALERNKRMVMRVVWFAIGFLLGAGLAHLSHWMMKR